MTRRRRTVRDSANRLALTDRDREVLRLVGLAGVLSTDQIRRDLFPSIDRARFRLRKLYDVRLLNRFSYTSSKPDAYLLTQRGLRELEADGRAASISLLRRAPSYSGEAHARLLGDVLLYLRALVRSTANAELLAWGRGRNAKVWSRSGLKGTGVVPDGMAVVASDGGEATLAIEADCATESVDTLSRKWCAYSAASVVDELWVVAAGGARRLDAIQRSLGEFPLVRTRTRLFDAQLVRDRPVRQPPTLGGSRASEPTSPERGRAERNNAHAYQTVSLRGPTSEAGGEP